MCVCLQQVDSKLLENFKASQNEQRNSEEKIPTMPAKLKRPQRPTVPGNWADTDSMTEVSTVIRDDDDIGNNKGRGGGRRSSDDDDTDDFDEEEEEDEEDEEEQDEEEDDEIIDMDAPLPEHHCRYCRRSDPLSAVRCNVCKKWFCNTREGTSGSHIIMHLARCKHKEVSLHPDGPMGDSALECFVCGSKNVFLLGFLPSKEESVVVIICREPCLNSQVLQEMGWDTSAWNAIIEERQLLPWIAANTDAAAAGEGEQEGEKRRRRRRDPRVRNISSKQINSLEDKWKIDPDADLDTVLPGRAAATLPEIPTDFVRVEDYKAIMSAHVEAEALTDKELKEKQIFESLTVRWSTGMSGRRVATLEIPTSENVLRAGDDVLIVYPDTQQTEVTCTVLSIAPAASMADEVQVELRPGAPDPPSADTASGAGAASGTGYRLKCTWNKAPYERMEKALRTFANDEMSISAYLFARILGQPIREQPPQYSGIPEGDALNAPGLARLNPSQHQTVREALAKPLALVQGPFGCGKTTVSATMVYHLAKMHKSQILVCGPSNVCVDQLAERIAATGLNVVRVCAKSREALSSAADKFTLHHLIREFVNDAHRFSELAKLFKLRDTVGGLSDSDKRRFARLCSEVERLILEEADVVCCTCVGAADPRLAPYRFKYVLIDECTHATEPECLIPLVSGAKQVILVGDHCQMTPVVLSRVAEKAGMARSLFERLVVLGERPHRLEIQYRMHPCMSEFSSNYFYEGSLANGVTAEERDSSRVFPWPNPRKPMFFYNSIAPEECGPSGVSYLNRAEAALAERIVTRLLKSGSVTPDQIGIITPYEAQRCYVVNYLLRNGTMPAEAYRRIEVASVDAFQGREKEFIVFTCVRSNDQQGIGFVQDWRRLNVALTRARRGMAIIGNARVLARNPLWHALVSHFKEQNLVVNGSVESGLVPVTIALPRPRMNPQLLAEMKAHSSQHYFPSFLSDATSSTDATSAARMPVLMNAPQSMMMMMHGGAAAAAAEANAVDYANQVYVPGGTEAWRQFQQTAGRRGTSSCASSSIDDTESNTTE